MGLYSNNSSTKCFASAAESSSGAGSFMAEALQWMQARLHALVSSHAISLGGFILMFVNGSRITFTVNNIYVIIGCVLILYVSKCFMQEIMRNSEVAKLLYDIIQFPRWLSLRDFKVTLLP
jgi:hypothetical protein